MLVCGLVSYLVGAYPLDVPVVGFLLGLSWLGCLALLVFGLGFTVQDAVGVPEP